jgi:hypothetical protein
MQVDIKEGGDGVACWNAEAITAYAAATDARETALASANPDLVVTPGRVKCYGCQVNDFALGIRCTAELTRTLYAVAGEVAPRAADASGSLADIPGLRSRVEETDAAPLVAVVTPAAPVTSRPQGSRAPLPPAAPERRSGLSRLLGRNH